MSRRPFRVGRSLTGLGLFATRPIKKRVKLVEYKGPRLNAKEAERVEATGNKYLFEINKNVTIDGKARSNVARYANHSCNPNAESIVSKGRMFIKTIKNIAPGDEITYDYGNDYLKNVIGKSNCKCSRCRRRKAKKQRERRQKMKRAKLF